MRAQTSPLQLCIVVCYFSVALNKIVSTFLGLVSLSGETAEAIASSLTSFLRSVGLDIKKCIGVGTDGCSVMVGRHNSVYTHLLQMNPNMQLLKCVCHSIQLCVSKAVETLPRNLDYLVSHSYKGKPLLKSVSVLPLYAGNLAALETQYEAVTFHSWTNKDGSQAEAFWVEVFNYRDSSGEQAFKDLAQFALSLLAMPLSNADVERVLSQMAIVKRNSGTGWGKKHSAASCM